MFFVFLLVCREPVEIKEETQVIRTEDIYDFVNKNVHCLLIKNIGSHNLAYKIASTRARFFKSKLVKCISYKCLRKFFTKTIH